MDNFPSDVLNYVFRFLGITRAGWYTQLSEQQTKLIKKGHKKNYLRDHWDDYHAQDKTLRVQMRGYVRQFLTFARVCRRFNESVDWTEIGIVCQDMAYHWMLRSDTVRNFTGATDRHNDLTLHDTFSSAFYRVALVRYLGRGLPRAEVERMNAFMQRERQKHIKKAKDRMRIDWSKRDRRPTKRPRRE